MASLPVVIFQDALTPYPDLNRLAWAGALLDRRLGAGRHHRRPRLFQGAETLMSPRWPPSPNGRMCRSRPVDKSTRQARRVQNLDFFYGKTRALKNGLDPLRGPMRSPP